jgi:protocatechuate 3,4-dioxygenase beta subunit
MKKTDCHPAILSCALLTVAVFVFNVNAQSGRAPQSRTVENGAGNAPAAASTQTTARGKGSVKGHVINEETGAPVRRTRVVITLEHNPRMVGQTLTNERGEFRFDNLPAGPYSINAASGDLPIASAATFAVPLPTGDPKLDAENFKQPESQATEVVVKEGASVEVEVRMPAPPRGGTISGRVLFEDGKPASEAKITFTNRKEIRGRMTGATKLSVTADKDGVYHASSLPPGEYTVSARVPDIIYKDKAGNLTGGVVTLTYYPSTTSVRSSTPISIALDQEAGDINITLIKRTTHALNGTLVSRNDARPLAHVQVRLRNREDMDLPFPIAETDKWVWTDAAGRWAFSNIMDGDYVISAGGGTVPAPARGMETVFGGNMLPPDLRAAITQPSRQVPVRYLEKRQEVTVAGADVKELAIQMSEGGRIYGIVVVEGDKPLPPRLMIVSGMKAGERRPSAMARMEQDGTFALSGIPEGPLALDVVINPPTLFVKAIMANGVDLMRQQLYVGEGSEIKDVRIVLSAEMAVLSGRVLSVSDNTPVRGVTVMLIPEVAGDATPLRGSRMIGMSNPEGLWRINCAPGEYRVVTWQQGHMPNNPEALKTLAATAQRVSVQASERKTLDLVVAVEK